MIRKSLLIASIAVCLTFGLPVQSKEPSAATLDHQAIFDSMKTLAGTYYELGEPDSLAQVDYRLISRGSALTETWFMPSGKEELTVFHMDNGVLVATHYCAAGIQSTMQLVGKSPEDIYQFRLRSATNLPSAEASHNSGFGYRFTDNQQVFRNEIWTTAGKASVSDLILKRQ